MVSEVDSIYYIFKRLKNSVLEFFVKKAPLTSRFVFGELGFGRLRFDEKVEYVTELDPTEDDVHWTVVLSVIRLVDVIVHLVILDQSCAVERNDRLKVKQLQRTLPRSENGKGQLTVSSLCGDSETFQKSILKVDDDAAQL